jgi:Holliday junction DNA helicase RuvA
MRLGSASEDTRVIRALRGALEAVGTDWVVVGVGGVSLQVFVPPSAVESLGPPGSQVRLHTHLSVREDNLSLYGFPTVAGLRLFELLLAVSGVGPRTALSLLSTLSPEALAVAIATEDATTLSTAPGVGKRTAARVILDLKGKLEQEWAVPATAPRDARGDVVEALLALGYSPTEARRAVAAVPQDPSLSLEEQVREALQHLAAG